MPKKRLMPMVVTILVLLLAVSGIMAFAAGGLFPKSLQVPTSAAIDQTDDDQDEDIQLTEESQETSVHSSTDATSSATQQPTSEETAIDGSSSATPRETVSSEKPDATSSATVNANNDDDEDDDDDDRDTDVDSSQLIGAEKARAIALAQTGADARILAIEFEDDYPPVYEVKLHAGNYKIELTIHAVTGAILDQERESADAED